MTWHTSTAVFCSCLEVVKYLLTYKIWHVKCAIWWDHDSYLIFFLFRPLYFRIFGIEDYSCTWSQWYTHTHTHTFYHILNKQKCQCHFTWSICWNGLMTNRMGVRSRLTSLLTQYDLSIFIFLKLIYEGGADKSLARRGRKEGTANKLRNSLLSPLL